MDEPRTASSARWAIAILALAAGSHAVSCAGVQKTSNAVTQAAAPSQDPIDNPLLRESELPYHLPPFDRIEDRHFAPALERGMAEQLQEVAAIAQSETEPTFENTIVALERSGRTLARALAVFSNLTQSNTNPQLDQIQSDFAPRLAAHQDAIYLDASLFSRVQNLGSRKEQLGLSLEQERLLERYHTRFVRAGAKLDDAGKGRLREINQRLSTLTTEFQQAVLKEVQERAVVVDDVARLEGLSPDQIAAARKAAVDRELGDKHLITLANTTGQPPLAQLEDRQLRRRIFEASIGRGLAGEHATTGLVAEVLELRAERARLLGYRNHAAYVLQDEMAKTPEAVNEMLGRLAGPAARNARAEAERMRPLIEADAQKSGTEPFSLQPWDWDYYAEKVRKAEYAYDAADVRPYFELDRVLKDGVFFSAERLYGLSFKERGDLSGYHDDVRVFEVFDADGSALGLFLFDPFARDNKRGGAWMSTFVEQSHLLSEKPVVTNNLNIVKPPKGKPVLLTFDEVTTAFHEFGHAVHGLLSDVEYPLLSGTAVPTDFVEYPSQYNEMWAYDETVLANYGKHHESGQPMPAELLDKVLEARKFNQGYATTEYLAAAALDQALHQRPAGQTPATDEIVAFEAQALERAELALPFVPPRYRCSYFSHIFADPMGYSAAYYAYIWSEVLARDTEHWLREHGGLTRDNGKALREHILSRGFSRDAMAMFEALKGGPPDVQPLLEARGLTSAPPPR